MKTVRTIYPAPLPTKVRDWLTERGFDIRAIPSDGMDLTPKESVTLVEWVEFRDHKGGDRVRTGSMERVLDEVAPFRLMSGELLDVDPEWLRG